MREVGRERERERATTRENGMKDEENILQVKGERVWE